MRDAGSPHWRTVILLTVAIAIAAQLLAAQGSAAPEALKGLQGGKALTAARTWYVAASSQEVGGGTLESPFRTIQQAINVATDGDVIVVLEGHYTGEGNVNLDFRGKAITVQSRAPEDEACVSATVLDAQGQGGIARFVHDEGPQTVFCGFTLLPGDRSVPVRGLPGFFEFSSQARPTTGELRVRGQAQRPAVPGAFTVPSGWVGSRVWEGYDPFQQPAATTDYYGSGDVDGDGTLSDVDLAQAQDMADGRRAPNFRADVDGSGRLDPADVSLLTAALRSGTILPAWWNHLPGRAQRQAWVDRFLALDTTNEHPYQMWYQCWAFSQQLFLHGAHYRGGPYILPFAGGQRGYNIPLYQVGLLSTEFAHAINAILVGDDPLNFDDWRFIEPQTDQDALPGMWNMPWGCYVTVEATRWMGDTGGQAEILVEFLVNPEGPEVRYANGNLVRQRPLPPSRPPDNRLDCWRPKVIPGQPGYIFYEQQREDLQRLNDIFVADLPFHLRPAGTPLWLAELEYSHILDAVRDAHGTVHLLWTGQPAYTPGIFYSQLDPASRTVTLTVQLSLGIREPLTGRLLVMPQGQVHAFWLEQLTYTSAVSAAGVYWTTGSGLAWQVPQNITPSIPDPVIRFGHSIDDREAIGYLFDVAASSEGEILLVYTAYLSAVQMPNDNLVYLVAYDGQWGSPIVVGDPPIQAYGLDLSIGSGDVLHLLCWFGELSWQTKGVRGNLYHMMRTGGSWSAPVVVDAGGLAGYPRSAVDAGGRLYAVWERETADSVVPVWAEYSELGWKEPEVLNVRGSADAWYPAVDILPGGLALLSWSSPAPDDVAIETEYRWLAPPAGQAFLPLVRRRMAGSGEQGVGSRWQEAGSREYKD